MCATNDGVEDTEHFLLHRLSFYKERRDLLAGVVSLYTTLIKQLRFENFSKSLPIVNMKISSPDSDLAPKL